MTAGSQLMPKLVRTGRGACPLGPGAAAGAGVAEDERPTVVSAPGQGKLTRRDAADRARDDVAPREKRRVPGREKADTAAVHKRLVGLLGAGDLRADHRWPAIPGVECQPVVAQRPGAFR